MKELFEEHAGTTYWQVHLSSEQTFNAGEFNFVTAYQNSVAYVRVVKNESLNSKAYVRSNNDNSIDICVQTDNILLIDGIVDRLDELLFKRVSGVEDDFDFLC